MKAALYVRVSTIEQATEGFSVGVQKEKLAAYALACNYEIVDTYSDEGFSGKSLVRPSVERLIADIKSSKIDIVLIYKLDRLSRRVKDVLELVELFEKYKVTLFSLNENLDLSSPFGRAALKMSATFSELERETIVERMTMGKNARAKQGKYSCPGRPPFGYILNQDTDRLDIIPQEAEAIREIYDKYLTGDYSFRKLYLYCKERYPMLNYFNNEMCCKPIIERPMYAGYFNYKGELYKGINFDPIISYETFLQASEQVKRNTTKRSSDNSPYLLTGLLICAQCGRRFVGKLYNRYRLKTDGERSKEYKYTSYGCVARIKYSSTEHLSPCCNDIFPSEVLDNYIDKCVESLKFTDTATELSPVGTIDKLLQENTELKKQHERLLDLYLNDSLDKEMFLNRSNDIEKKLNKNLSIIASEKENLASAPTISFERIIQKQKEYPTASKKEKQALLRQLIEYIVIDGEQITVKWRLK